MLEMNKKMAEEYNQVSLQGVELAPELKDIAESGFEEIRGRFYLRDLLPKVEEKEQEQDMDSHELDETPCQLPPMDDIGAECFINSLHIDDYVQSDYFAQGILFAKEVLRKWKLFNQKLELAVILSQSHDESGIMRRDGLGVNVKFYVRRDGDEWVFDDLEGFEQEEVMVVDSTETSFYQ